MPSKSKTRKLQEIHETALRQFEDAWNANWPDREHSLDARRFVDVRGAQWDWDRDDAFRSKMKLEINEVALAFNKEANELAKVAANGNADAVGDQLGKLGSTCKGCHDDFKAKK